MQSRVQVLDFLIHWTLCSNHKQNAFCDITLNSFINFLQGLPNHVCAEETSHVGWTGCTHVQLRTVLDWKSLWASQQKLDWLHTCSVENRAWLANSWSQSTRIGMVLGCSLVSNMVWLIWGRHTVALSLQEQHRLNISWVLFSTCLITVDCLYPFKFKKKLNTTTFHVFLFDLCIWCLQLSII